MEPITLVTTAIALATPYLVKSGEVVAEKIGESIWNLIKKPFAKDTEDITAINFNDEKDIEKLQKALLNKINQDGNYKFELLEGVKKAEKELQNNQQINNYDEVQKQINIGHNSGNIQM